MEKQTNCPECKNDVDMATFQNSAVGDVIECDKCGITLEMTNIADDGVVSTEIADEGK